METNIDKGITSETEIDLFDLGKQLWVKRKFILKASGIGLVIGIIVAFSIPKEYTTTVVLAPESASSRTIGGAGALAAMAGINLEGDDGQISPDLYPNIIESTPFILGLFDVKVRDKRESVDTTLYYYLKEHQSLAWWSKIFGIPRTLIGFFSKEAPKENSDVVNPFLLSNAQSSILNNLKGRISISVDKKTGIISLSTTMQSAEISANIADTLTSYLQSYVISYRTQKARQDLAFSEKLYTEAKKDYESVQQKYARYIDENQNVILASYRVNQEKLQNEVTLAYNVYNQMAQQMQLSKVKVQDVTPVYTIIQPSVISLVPVKPNKKIIVVGFIFLAVLGVCGYILVGNYFKMNMKANSNNF